LGRRRASKIHRARHEGVETLDKFAVPEAEQAEIKAIIGSTRTDIVV
jgi:hypothetical protein